MTNGGHPAKITPQPAAPKDVGIPKSPKCTDKAANAKRQVVAGGDGR